MSHSGWKKRSSDRLQVRLAHQFLFSTFLLAALPYFSFLNSALITVIDNGGSTAHKKGDFPVSPVDLQREKASFLRMATGLDVELAGKGAGR